MRIGGARVRFRSGWAGSVVAAALAVIGQMLTAVPQAAPSEQAGLTPFASCDALRQWYVDHTIGQVGAYGWNGPIVYAMRDAAPLHLGTPDAAASSPEAGVANGATGTNTQEAGIDEPDVAKTDGRIVVRLQGQRLVITDVTGAAPRELATWTLPSGINADGLLLVDGHVLLSGGSGGVYWEDSMVGGGGRTGTSELFDLDVSVPTAPRLVNHTTWSGSTLSLRQYGDTVRLVTSTGLPALAFVQPGKGISESEATSRNREVVRESTIQQWLPHVSVNGATSHRAVDCSAIYHPDLLTGPTRDTATLGVFTLHPGAAEPTAAVAVTGRGSQVYSSSDRLYVWDTNWNDRFLVPDARRTPFRPMMRPRTDVHAFALDGDQTRYVASGRIDGQVRDRWSFDEHDGHLRVAVTWPGGNGSGENGPGENGIVVLDERGDHLVEVGRLRGLGPNEQIQSVRWFDDLAVLVTFRQVDPLYTVDLTDPEHPRALGALHLSGFSGYLHPIGDDQLLGLGTEMVGGQGEAAKVATFDLSDPTAARQVDRVGFGPGSWLVATEDPHAFTFVPGAGGGTAVTTVARSGIDGTVPVAIRVAGGHLSTWFLPSPGGENQRALPLPDGRVALTGRDVVLTSLQPAVE